MTIERNSLQNLESPLLGGEAVSVPKGAEVESSQRRFVGRIFDRFVRLGLIRPAPINATSATEIPSNLLDRISKAVVLVQNVKEAEFLGRGLERVVVSKSEGSIIDAFNKLKQSDAQGDMLRAIELIKDSNLLDDCGVRMLESLMLASAHVCTDEEGENCTRALLSTLQEKQRLTPQVLRRFSYNPQVLSSDLTVFKRVLEETGSLSLTTPSPLGAYLIKNWVAVTAVGFILYAVFAATFIGVMIQRGLATANDPNN